MKLLSPPFSSSLSSSSSSASASFDANICNSKSATAGCLAGILRRILCSTTLPTHPSDLVTEESNSIKSFCQELKVEDKILSLQNPPPGLVARLMGLESMPDVDFKCVKSRPNSVSRSRSMNSTDRLAGYYDSKQQHRRVKSTTSFRETPEFLELGNEEFFILSFENVSESREFRPKEKKSKAGCGELRQRRAKKGENRPEKAATTTMNKKEDQEGKRKVLSEVNGKDTLRRRCSDNKRTSNKVGDNVKVKDSKTSLVSSTKTSPQEQQKHVVVSEAVKSRKPKNCNHVLLSNGVKPNLNKKKNDKTTKRSQLVKPVEEFERTSEDSSPVSVLDIGQFLVDPQVPISEEDCGSTTTSSRRKLSLEVDNNYERQCSRRDKNLMVSEVVAREGKLYHSQGKEYALVLDEICRLSESELFGSSSNWVKRLDLSFEEYQCIAEELESQIFGQLLWEVVDQP